MTMRSVEPAHQTSWDGRAAIQFICGGAGAGLLFFTALAAFPQTSASGGRGEGWPVWTALFGMGFVSLGLLSVFIKLGRRWRAAFVVRNPFTSWMTREALLAPPTLGLALLAILLNNAILLMAAAVFGLGFLYAQARILQEAQGIPAWREPLTVWLMVTTGLTEGAALWVMMAPFFGGEGGCIAGTTRSYTALLVGLSAARLGLWAVYRRKLAQPGAAPVRTNDALAEASRTIVVAGHIVPMLAALGALFFMAGEETRFLGENGFLRQTASGAIALGFIAGLAALLGGWYLKFTLIARAAFTQGFALVKTPARTPGYSGPGTKPGWNRLYRK